MYSENNFLSLLGAIISSIWPVKNLKNIVVQQIALLMFKQQTGRVPVPIDICY